MVEIIVETQELQGLIGSSHHRQIPEYTRTQAQDVFSQAPLTDS